MRLLCLLLVLCAAPALAAPPPGADPTSPTAVWFRSLKIPGTEMSCCDTSDCRYTEDRIVGDHYEAWVDPSVYTDGAAKPHWVEIPKDRILAPDPTAPSQQAVLCYAWGRVYCFHAGTGT